MNFLRSLFLNFLIVFFVDAVVPGIEVLNYENVPNVGDDILFSFVVGLLNASIFFCLSFFELKVTHFKLALCSFMISFGAFLLIAAIPFGIQVVSASGLIVGGLLVWAMGYFTNYLEWKHESNR